MRTTSFILGLTVAALGCGDDSVNHLADAAMPIDGPSIDAAPPTGSVTVTVTLQGEPASAVPVYFQDADSTVVSSATTGSDGTASATMASGGFVTVLEPQEVLSVLNDQILDTFSGVKIGDSLHVDVDPVFTGATDTNTFNVTVPVDPNVNVTQYFLFSTCGEGGEADITPPATAPSLRARARNVIRPRVAVANNPPVQITLGGCGGTADVVIATFDDQGTLLDAIFAPSTAIADGSDLTVAGAYVAVTPETINETGIPASVGDVEFFQEVRTPRGVLFDGEANGVQVTSGSATLTTGIPPAGSDAIVASIAAFEPQGVVEDNQSVVDWGPAPGATIANDFSAEHLASWVTFPQYDVVDNDIAWSVEKAGVVPDFVLSSVDVNRFDAVNDLDTDWTWNFAAPGSDDGAIAIPTLPTDVFDFNPHDTDDVFVFRTAGVTSPGGYDAARATVFDVADDLVDEPQSLAGLSATGHVVIQETNNGGDIKAHRHRATHRPRAHTRLTRGATK